MRADSRRSCYKRLLQNWDANTEFDLKMDNCRPDVAINSSSTPVIKAALATHKKFATHRLVLVKTKAHSSSRIRWEIDWAEQPDIRLPLAAVKLARENVTPLGLLDNGTAWATSFSRDHVIEALRSARVDY